MMHEHTMPIATHTFDPIAAFNVPRAVRPALMIGGATWLAYYGMWIWSGVTTGHEPAQGTPFGLASAVVFFIALVGITGGLASLGMQLRKFAAGFGNAGLAFALIALVCSVVGIASIALGAIRPGTFGGLGVVGSCLGATLLGIAALRSKALARRDALVLLAIGVVTFPLIVAITAILPTLPSWIVDEMPFAIAGLSWIVFAALLKRR